MTGSKILEAVKKPSVFHMNVNYAQQQYYQAESSTIETGRKAVGVGFRNSLISPKIFLIMSKGTTRLMKGKTTQTETLYVRDMYQSNYSQRKQLHHIVQLSTDDNSPVLIYIVKRARKIKLRALGNRMIQSPFSALILCCQVSNTAKKF